MKRYKCFGMVEPKMIEDDNGDYILYTPLFAAAPELLEALEDLLEATLEPTNALVFAMSLSNAQSAIAKAKGQTP